MDSRKIIKSFSFIFGLPKLFLVMTWLAFKWTMLCILWLADLIAGIAWLVSGLLWFLSAVFAPDKPHVLQSLASNANIHAAVAAMVASFAQLFGLINKNWSNRFDGREKMDQVAE